MLNEFHEIGIHEAAQDLLDARKRLGYAVMERHDLWKCLEECATTPPTTNDAILPAFSPQGLDEKEGGKITQAAVDAALDAEFATDAGGDVPAVGYSYSIREVMEEFGANLSTREIENAMHTALAAALNPPAGNKWAISFDREGPR